MVSSLVHNAAVVSVLLQRRFILIRHNLVNTLIDAAVWPTVSALVFGYIMPAIGNVDSNFGPFVFVGSVLTVCMVGAFAEGNNRLWDFEGGRRIDYEMTLPISATMVYISHILSIFVQIALVNLPIFLVGKIVLMHRFDFSQFCLWKFMVVYLAINSAFASVGLFTVNLARNAEAFKHVWLRLFNFMLWMGCYFFTWKQVYAVYPWASYLMLINPVTYSMEGLRGAFFGSTAYIPFWVCCGALMLQAVFFGWVSIVCLSRRLDSV